MTHANAQERLLLQKEPLQEEGTNHESKTKSMSREDLMGILILAILYTLQGIPMNFFGKTLQILFVENGAHSSDLATLSLGQMPFAYKFLAAPFMDTHYFKRLGKRKSYIIPMQYLFGVMCFGLSYYLETEIKTLNVFSAFLFGAAANTIMAIQDVAVDGWVITMLSPENRAYGAFAQTMGLALGGIISFNLFIPLSSIEFCNKYIYTFSREVPILTVQSFWFYIGIITILITFLIHMFKREKEIKSIELTSVWEVAKSLKSFWKNPNLRKLLLVAVTSCICIAPIYALTEIKLIQKDFPKETLTNIITALIPFKILVSFYVSKFCKRKMEMKVKFWVYSFSYLNYSFLFWTIQRFHKDVNYSQTFYFILIGYALDVVGDSGHFISDGSYWNRVCDEAIGGTFLTLLAAVTNLGFLWPESLSLYINEFIPWEYMGLFFLIITPIYLIWYKKQVDELHTKNAVDFRIHAQKND